MTHISAQWCNQAGKNLYDAFLKQVKNKLNNSHGKDFSNLPCYD